MIIMHVSIIMNSVYRLERASEETKTGHDRAGSSAYGGKAVVYLFVQRVQLSLQRGDLQSGLAGMVS